MSENDISVCSSCLLVAIRLQELIKLRNLEHPSDPIRSLLLDMDFRCVCFTHGLLLHRLLNQGQLRQHSCRWLGHIWSSGGVRKRTAGYSGAVNW